MRGIFKPFCLDFSKLSNEAQAKTILTEVDKLHKDGYAHVGITYSANQSQKDTILRTYRSRGWKTNTTGANQAAVMREVEQLLETEKYKHLQTVFRIVPITTMKASGTAADNASVNEGLQNAEALLQGGGALLGWQNQHTPKDAFAIGGGVNAALRNNPTVIDQQLLIQGSLQNLLSEYQDSVYRRMVPQEREESRATPAPVISDRAALKAFYTSKEAGGGFFATRKIFNPKKTDEEVITRLRERAEKNTDGASEKTLNHFEIPRV